MTLGNDRQNRKRPPMGVRAQWAIIGGAVAVLIFVVIVLAVSGQSFF